MHAHINERLAIPGLIVGILALVIGISTSALMVAIAALFCVYLVVVALAFVVIAIRNRSFATAVAALFFVAASTLIVIDVVGDSQTTFGPAQTGGCVTFALLLLTYGLTTWRGYSRGFKNCPECVGTVDASARVCRHCGYRWKPPLAEERQDSVSGDF